MKSRKIRKPNSPLGRDPALPFSDHISELRSRIFVYGATLIGGTVIGYALHPTLIALLTKPLGQPLFYASVTGGFDFVFQLSVFFGFLFSIPMLLYQIFRFVEPALPPLPIKKMMLYLLASIGLLGLGTGFAYFVSLPATLFFLGSFAKGNIKTLISTTEYFTFISRYLVGFGLAFQLPLILLFVDSLHPIQLKTLFYRQREVIVGCFIAAAVLTPTPDIVNQLIFAVPLILLYQFSLVGIWIQHQQRGHRPKRIESGKKTKKRK